MTVSAALQWAWRDELPKMPAAERPAGLSAASAWASILRYGELHSVIDRQPNRYGCVPFDVAGWPHADALRIAEAVEALAGLVVEVPDGWNPAPELVAIDADLARKAVEDTLRAAIVERDGETVFRVAADVLVVRHAILGTVPQWRMDLPEATVEIGEGGRPKWYVLREIPTVVGTNPDGSDRIVTETIEVDGWSSRKRRPLPGAYQRRKFDPDPVPAMVERAEYEIFAAAMTHLAGDLSGRLETIEIVADEWPARPWCESPDSAQNRRTPKILPDLEAAKRPGGAPKRQL
ncbi:hypothetical protein [Oricola thermophila]|uniref:Uncharacterized protein n=1 Tax=Oricola thermophila TaxID=2742145 RepID=A0A6N1VKH2_9HYPH|nr:hypothetical protein [Oricola thermophila]QKV20255.1 hypothetical protein HTY61_18250 [Oricola thermophila]